jgi:N-acetylmuramoyl-L-alanine amidase
VNIAIRIGHHGKGTGASAGGRDEVDLADRYGHQIHRALIAAGHTVVLYPSTKARYGDDYRRINADGTQLYLQLHINSASSITPAKNHGIVFYDRRSVKGPKLAVALIQNLSTGYPWRATNDGAPGYERVHPCIAGCKPVALLIEPWFIQCDVSPEDIGAKIGAALVAALDAGMLA